VRRGADLFARDENLAVLDRPHPEWDPLGVRAGGFVVLPRIRVETAYDDNVFATSTDEKGDVRVSLEPALDIASNWNQNAFSLKARGILQRYATYPSLDNDQYSVTGDVLLNVRHDFTIAGEVSQARNLIPRSSDAYAPDSVTPLFYDETAATMALIKSFNFLKLTVIGSFANVIYEDGVMADGSTLYQGFQNRTTYGGSVRADVAISPDVAVFVQETIRHSDVNSYLRSHDETETLVGPNFQIAHLVTVDFGVGYLTSTYANPMAKSVGNFTARGMISYFPTPLLTIRLTGRQEVIESGLINSPAYLSRQVGLEGDYELLRNLIIIGSFEGAWNHYQVIDRRDFQFVASLKATYKVSHAVALDLTVARRQRFSYGVAAAFGFVDDIASVGVTVQR
jgi:hypothetical protein